MKLSNSTKSKWSEIRTDYQDEHEGIILVDAWTDPDDDEGGSSIAEINARTGQVHYRDLDARFDPLAKEIIREAVEQVEAKHPVDAMVYRMRKEGMDLNRLLEEISVMDEWENQVPVMEGWHAVVNDYGIIAYFSSESEAFKYRLDLINRVLNG